MVARSFTVAFEGIEAPLVEVQCAVAAGLPSFAIVGLPNKSVSEARERVRAALSALSIALPAKRITINLSPADMPKDGSHYDLAIAIALLAEIGVVPRDAAEGAVVLGELALSGELVGVAGALPAAVAAAASDRCLVCPADCGAEAAWVDAAAVYAAPTLSDAIAHMSGERPLSPAEAGVAPTETTPLDLRDVRGQERAKRALEIAAAGRHHLLLVGTPGAGKSMLAERLPSILPDLDTEEALETSMIQSRAGLVDAAGISRRRPYRRPHHTASMAAIVGGGKGAQPGEISLAHNGVLFLDEFPEFPRGVLETLRQPIETGDIHVSRANAHVRYPCRFLLIAAANPCRCGYLPESGDTSADVASRVARARAVQSERYAGDETARTNADAGGALLDRFASLDDEGKALMTRAADHFGFSARAYHRVRRVARTIADLAGAEAITAPHVAEAIGYRLTTEP